MIRTYSNKKIYGNFNIIKTLSIISIVIAVLTVISFTCVKCINYPDFGIDQNLIMFYVFILITPIIPLTSSLSPHEPKLGGKSKTETKLNNDFTNLLSRIIISFTPYILLMFFFLLFICFRSPDPVEWAHFCGYMLPSHLFVYIADGFLIHNCILIKREWKNDPPIWLKNKY